MPSYKVSNKPRMHFCANNVICSIHASLCSIHASLLLEVRQVCAFKSYLNIHLLNNYALVFTLGYLLYYLM